MLSIDYSYSVDKRYVVDNMNKTMLHIERERERKRDVCRPTEKNLS